MKNEDAFILNETEKEESAQAVNESELLPIYNNMDVAGDIQPLEDVEEPEYLETDYDVADNKSSERNREIKKKAVPLKTALKIYYKQIIAAVIVLVIIGIGAGFLASYLNANRNLEPLAAVYTSDSETKILLDDGTEQTITDADEVKVSKDGLKMYFSRDTSSKTGKYDIRFIDLTRKKSLRREGSHIDNAIDEGWQINADGSFMCYSKTSADTKKSYLYSAEEKKSDSVSNDTKELFLPPVGDVVYFTRQSGSIYSLHRKRYGEEPQSVASGIDYVKSCESDEGFQILYTVRTGKENNVDVYMVTGLNAPMKVCSNVSEVYLPEYEYGGNLYYFTKNNSKINWQDFINDPYFDRDAAMSKPKESDYMVEKGFIFKRYVLDTSAYSAAKNRYQSKLLRDRIREELDSINMGITADDEYSCYAYNGTTTKKLVSGISLQNIFAYSLTGNPKIIYGKSVIDVENKITMDKLVNIASEDDVSSAIDYVINNVSDSYELTDDCFCTCFDGSKVVQYTVDGYELSKTEFLFHGNNIIYGLSEGDLYYSEISSKGVSKKEFVDSSVEEPEIKDSYIYYTKISQGDEVSLLRFNKDSGKHEIGKKIYDYFPINDNFTIILTKPDTDSELMNIGVFDEEKFRIIDKNASLTTFKYNNTAFAYVKNIASVSSSKGGEMYIYRKGKGSKTCSKDVTKILYVND